MAIFIKHIEGSKTGQLESFDQDQIRIGRQSDNEISFDPQKDASVSGYHAEIYRDGEAFFIKDLQSRNGTFVNSRKINQPVLLKEGDILQFSARGPKVVFSSRDPSSVDSSTSFAEPPGGAPTQVFTAGERETPEKKAGVWERIQPAVPIASAVLALLALVGGGLYLGFSWWALLIGAAVIVPAAGGAYLGWASWQRRKAHVEQEAAVREEREASLEGGNRNELQDLRRKWAEVIRSLKNSKLQSLADDPIYALPWFVLMGEPGSGKSSLIKTSGPFSSVVTPGQDGPTRNCDWWFFDKALILDTSGRYAFQAKGSDSAQEWQELLNLLQTNRRKEPINGVVITVPADSLTSRPVDTLKEQAAQLRERIDEMVQRLGVKFPVYLAISKCDLIAGFTEFFAALPDRVRSQALGQVNSDLQNTDASRFFDRTYRNICERAQRLRLAFLNEEEKFDVTHGTFLFPAELQCLYTPLKAFIDVLFRPSPYRDMPLFRGLFLASARQAGSPSSPLARLLGINYAQSPPTGTTRDLFLRDIFSVILPNDRALVGHTAVTREHSQLTRAAGLIIAVAASLLVCGLFTLSFTNNWLALNRLDFAPCNNPEKSAGSVAQALRPLDECRQNIVSLTPQSRWKKVAYNFGLGYTDPVARVLQQRFLTMFRTGVLNPLDARIDQRINEANTGSLVVASVIQRIRLLARCQEHGGCVDLETSDGLGYRVMLSVAEQRVKDGDPVIERLRRTYESYLLWQPDPKVFAEMHAKDLERIRGWVGRGGLREDSVLESAKSQFRPVQAVDFWGVKGPVQVDAAYTASAWREGIEPLISGLRTMAPDASDVSGSVKRFELNYRTQALRQWRDFLAEFPQLEKSAAQKDMRELALNVAGADSPYQRAIDSAHGHLSVVLGDAWQGSDLPGWAATLKKYVALKAKLAQAQKSGKPDSQEKKQDAEANALNYLTIYLEALSQLRTELSTTKKSFESAQKAFEEGETGGKATHPILKAYWALGMLRDTIGSPQQEDRIFWILLARPLALAWRAMLDESGKYLQQQWEGLLLEVKDLDPGPKGAKIIAFVNGSAAAFLSRQGERWVPRRLLDQNLPFTDLFVQYLSRLRLDAMSTGALQPSPGPEPPFYIARTS